jgi:two-component system response regulator LytT
MLDIQMPGLTGMQMADALQDLEAPPLLEFVTGYSKHALAAFDHDALDYLVKPVAPDRLAKTLERAQARLADRQARAQAGRQAPQWADHSSPLIRLPIREDYSVRLIRVEEILYAFTRNKRILVKTNQGEYRTYYTLTQLETLLPAERFMRVHDSWLVNLECVQELIFLGNHAYVARLENNNQVPVSRWRFAQLQRRLGLDKAR